MTVSLSGRFSFSCTAIGKSAIHYFLILFSLQKKSNFCCINRHTDCTIPLINLAPLSGQIREYIVNPYQMAAVNGRYYLICNLDKYDEVSNYRLDRIADIRLLSTPVKEQAKVKGLEHGLNLPQHMAEHIYMFAGESIHITFRADKRILNDVMDWFSAADFSNELEDTIDVTVKVNRQAMFCWAMQYGPYVEVLKPAELREELGQSFAQIAKIYEKDSL